MSIVLWLLLLSVEVVAVYDVPSYYGHFSKNYLNPEYILKGTLVPLLYHFTVDASRTTIFKADFANHCIYKQDKSTKKVSVLMGKCGHAGNIIGHASSALFNGVSSVAYYNGDNTAPYAKVQIVADRSCFDCNLSAPYPPLTMENLRVQTIMPSEGPAAGFLFVADKNNHCIKKINLTSMIVSVVAGLCGHAGFQDGPRGKNRLNGPSNLAISAQGVLYFFDSNNAYIRLVKNNSYVVTLLLGACQQCTSFLDRFWVCTNWHLYCQANTLLLKLDLTTDKSSNTTLVRSQPSFYLH